MIALETKNLRALANASCRTWIAATLVAAFIVLATAKQAHAQSADAPYPKMAATDQYLMTETRRSPWQGALRQSPSRRTRMFWC